MPRFRKIASPLRPGGASSVLCRLRRHEQLVADRQQDADLREDVGDPHQWNTVVIAVESHDPVAQRKDDQRDQSQSIERLFAAIVDTHFFAP